MKKSLLKGFDRSTLTVAIIALLGIIFITNSQTYIQTTFFGIKLWATAVLPSILPFYFLTGIFTMTGFVEKLAKGLSPVARVLYRSNGISLYARLMSVLCGYPMGAKILSELYLDGIITRTEAEKYSTFSSTAGPIYIVGTISIGMFNSPKIGVILLFSHLLSSALTGVLFRKMPINRPIGSLFNKEDTSDALYKAMHQAVTSALMVGGFSAVFYTFGQMAIDFKILEPLVFILSPILGREVARIVLVGLVECTTGALMLSSLPLSRLNLSLTSGLIAFGGIAVWFQTIGYLTAARVRIKVFAASKAVHTILAFLICYILSAFV